eukprot:CAMPEP_0201879310 /NCGR_PEP_ID=MMETSP0902-20130614/10226_1 /ASSEMBLY_ACC=CAM_ASM_000551 /TAXON_ID=420261 /ORGANISM="Thalassiosira antarctica, Strain CCMP982" /LENGTH=60 /DNA_ID=CAMNT_0048407107 /DNA_START=516 /DNA_END=695 /DNA_ORIENTATION=+
MIHADIDEGKINQCMNNSGGVDGDVENSLLEVQLLGKDKTGVVILPAMYVNRVSLEFPMW